MTSPTARTGAVALALAAALASAVLVPTTGAAVTPRAARECRPPDYPGSGYFTSLTVRRTSCATGRKLALAYYRCRTRTGPAGRCNRRVMRFSCNEVRNSIATEIDGRVRCKRGAARVTHTYQQNL